MLRDITGDRIANALRMDKSFQGIFLVVEGARDHVFFNKFISKQHCQIYIAQGKPNLIESITILNEENFDRVLGVLDKDFNSILGINITTDNLICTDFHDIEISIVESPALEHVLETHCSKEKLDKLEGSRKKAFKDLLYELVLDIGCLKLANKIHELDLTFKPEAPDGKTLTYSDFIDINKLTFKGDESLLTSVLNYSVNKPTKPKPRNIIEEKYQEVKKNGPYDLKHLCNGHDMTFIIQLALKRKIGTASSNEYTQKRVELDLIFAYDSADFLQTQLYKEITAWEAKKGKKILKV